MHAILILIDKLNDKTNANLVKELYFSLMIMINGINKTIFYRKLQDNTRDKSKRNELRNNIL